MKQKNILQKRNNKNVKYRNGVYLNDMVKYNGIYGWVYGFSGGERSYECLARDVDGNLIKMIDRTNSLSLKRSAFIIMYHNNGWQFGRKSVVN